VEGDLGERVWRRFRRKGCGRRFRRKGLEGDLGERVWREI